MTVTESVPPPARPNSSVTVIGIARAPTPAPAETIVRAANTRSPATTSPPRPSSRSGSAEGPPSAEASAVRLNVWLGGFDPAAAVAVMTSVWPCSTGLGVPVALVIVGLVGAVAASTTMSSMPTHSSLPAALVVMMRSCTTAWLSTADGRVTSTDVDAGSPGLARSWRPPRTPRARWSRDRWCPRGSGGPPAERRCPPTRRDRAACSGHARRSPRRGETVIRRYGASAVPDPVSATGPGPPSRTRSRRRSGKALGFV